jgi:hypothetical protein
VDGAKQRARDRGVRVGIAAGHYSTDDAVFERAGVKKLVEGVLECDQTTRRPARCRPSVYRTASERQRGPVSLVG